MTERDLSMYERLEIAMRYAVPLLRDLQAELGEDVVLDALRARLERRIEAAAAEASPPPDLADHHDRMVSGFAMFAVGDVLDYEVIASDAQRVDVDVHACGYARLMAELDATDLGHLLICSEDDVGAARSGMELVRTQTRMQGGSHCDFRFRPKSARARSNTGETP